MPGAQAWFWRAGWTRAQSRPVIAGPAAAVREQTRPCEPCQGWAGWRRAPCVLERRHLTLSGMMEKGCSSMKDDKGWKRFEAAGVVNAPPSKTYRLLERVDLYPRWIPHLARSYALTDGPVRHGSRVVFHLAVAGLSLRIESLVTNVVPERVLAFRSVAGPALRGYWALSPEGEGTRVEFSMEYQLPGGPVGLAARLVNVEVILVDAARRAVDRFRALAEHSSASSGR